MNRVFYKDRAKAMLSGKWVIASLVALAYLVITGDSIIKFNNKVNQSDFQQFRNMLNGTGDFIKKFGFWEYLPFKNALGSFFARFSTGAILPIGLTILVVGVLVQTFLLNPLIVGITRYFRLTDLGLEAGMDDILFAFRSPHYKNIYKTMFFKDLYLFLWSLLLIIPGIIKSYEYIFIPWILSENPEMEMNDVFQYSRQMTNERKVDLFILDLSFLGWALVVAISFGLLNPVLTAYTLSTKSAVYNSFSGRTEPEPAYA